MHRSRVVNAAAAVFLLAVGAAAGLVARDILRPDHDGYDLQVLTRDLEAFAGAGDDPSEVIDTFPCTGEGSAAAAAAQRGYVAPGTVETVQQNVAEEAAKLGWIAVPPPVDGFDHIEMFEKGDRSLRVEVTAAGDSQVQVDLGVSGGDPC